jgi:hypothetical protein
MPDAFINPPSEGYSIKRSDRSVFRDYSLRNILSMAPSGGSTAFNANAYYKLKQNFMPAKVGDKDVFTNGVGTRVIEGTRGYRLYKPDGSLEGVYGDLETAMDKGRKVSYQPSYDPESKVEPSGVPSIPSGDTTEASRLAYFNSPEGIQARRERFAAISAKLASDFETVLSRPVESLNPERIAAGLDELDAQINAAAQAALERLGISSVADQIAQERQAQTEQKSAESFAARKQQQAQSAAVQAPPPLTTHQAFRNVIAARRKPVIQVNLSRTFFPAAKATARELQRK